VDWLAPDLDCAVLKTTSDRRDQDGNILSHFERRATRISQGPPEAIWFAIPDDYLERSPSQLHAGIVKGRDSGLSEAARERTKQRLAREDERYYANHRAAGK